MREESFRRYYASSEYLLYINILSHLKLALDWW